MKKIIFGVALLMSSYSYASVPIDRVTAYSSDGVERSPIAYPDPKPGYKIQVVRPGFDYNDTRNNVDKQVELIFNKPLMTDSCNDYSFSGDLAQKDVPGAEYEKYFELTVGDYMTTLMGCGDPTMSVKPVRVFIKQGLVDFDDAIVLYVPSDVVVTFRVWQPGATQTPSAQ